MKTEYSELHLKYRPRKLTDIVGQTEAVASLTRMLEENTLPHSILFTGGPGIGKTSTARILAKRIGCDRMEVHEINAADDRGIEMAREIIQLSRTSPMVGDVRCFIIDELHQLSKKLNGDAQTTLLKIVEEPPHHCYFFGCTTHPEELLLTLRSRMVEVKLQSIPVKVLVALVHDVALKENKPITDALCKIIADAANGGARNALKLLHQVIDLTEDEQVAFFTAHNHEEEDDRVGALLKAMLWERGVSWPAIQAIIREMPNNEDWEGFRYKLLAGSGKIMLMPKGQHSRAYAIIQACRDNWREVKREGLLAAVYEIFRDHKEK